MLQWKSNEEPITYSVCVCVFVCVVLVFQNAGISSLCASVAFFNIIPLTARFVEKIIEHTNCVLIFFATFISDISLCKKNSAGYYHKYT
jgi:hypothetical protein